MVKMGERLPLEEEVKHLRAENAKLRRIHWMVTAEVNAPAPGSITRRSADGEPLELTLSVDYLDRIKAALADYPADSGYVLAERDELRSERDHLQNLHRIASEAAEFQGRENAKLREERELLVKVAEAADAWECARRAVQKFVYDGISDQARYEDLVTERNVARRRLLMVIDSWRARTK